MKNVGRMGIHYLQRLNADNVPKDLIEKGQTRVIEASLTLIRERAKLKVYSDNLAYIYLSSITLWVKVWYLVVGNHVIHVNDVVRSSFLCQRW